MTDPAPATDAAAQPVREAAPPNDARQSVAVPLSVHLSESIQTVLTALMLAFMFRAFFVEPFIIPTGSMAESLLGRHGTVVCPTCGWEFDYGPGAGHTNHDGSFHSPARTYCPNCHTRTVAPENNNAIRAGDRILVHKWPYAIGGPLRPKRWDVIVFRDPANPTQNYIKRVVALPNETIEIIDGDVFIKPDDADEFRIARKTAAAQSVLWFVVFDQNYLPTDPVRARRSPAWVPEPPTSQTTLGWSGLETRVIRLDAHDGTPHTLAFEPTGSRRYLQDVYGYNHGAAGNYVGDVRIVAEVTFDAGSGWLRWEIIRDHRLFAVQFHHDGRVLLSTKPPGADADEIILAATHVPALTDRRPHLIEFAHLDYRVLAKLNGRQLLATTAEQHAPQLDELRSTRRIAPLQLRMVAVDFALTMRNLRVDRDVHYAYNPPNTARAYAGHPFSLGDDEYFVLGDNSPASVDSREWYRIGPHLEQALGDGSYQLGTVRADQIVGRAFFVYLPGLLPMELRGGWRIPDLGRVRFIR